MCSKTSSGFCKMLSNRFSSVSLNSRMAPVQEPSQAFSIRLNSLDFGSWISWQIWDQITVDCLNNVYSQTRANLCAKLIVTVYIMEKRSVRTPKQGNSSKLSTTRKTAKAIWRATRSTVAAIIILWTFNFSGHGILTPEHHNAYQNTSYIDPQWQITHNRYHILFT